MVATVISAAGEAGGPATEHTTTLKVLALSSGGGHWVQLLRLRPAFEDQRVTYASTLSSDRHDVEGCRFRTIPDANRENKPRAVLSLLGVTWLVLTERPNVIISTGALPGYLAIRVGKLIGARSIWVDSIANADQLSMSGRRVGKHVDLWLTQWEHLAEPAGAQYSGSVFG
jgi:UDP-N-acetylglucosamine:LPS N-acetylglucosamine transferase